METDMEIDMEIDTEIEIPLIHNVIPIELMSYIFSMIDVYSLFARLVCKQWCSFIELNDDYVDLQARLLVKHKDMHCLKYLMHNDYPLPINDEFRKKFSYLLGKNGSIDEIECVLNYGYSIDNSYLCYGAAKYSHLNILQELTVNDKLFVGSSENLFGKAASGGNIEILEWLRNIKVESYDTQFSKSICVKAAKHGHIHVLEWAMKYTFQFFTKKMYAWVARNYDFNMLNWLLNNIRIDSDSMYAEAATYGHLNILKLLKEKGFPLVQCIFERAARRGHFEIIKWAYENNCPKYYNLIGCAASSGNLEIVQWLYENGFPLNNPNAKLQYCIMYNAAIIGNLEIIKWAHQRGCQDTTTVCRYAAAHGHLSVFKWALDNGCIWDPNICQAATRNGHLHIIECIKEKNLPFFMDMCMEYAAMCGHLEIIKWGLSNGYVWTNEACIHATEYDRINILRFAIINGFPIHEQMWKMLSLKGHVLVLKLAMKHKYFSRENIDLCKQIAMKLIKTNHYHLFQYAIKLDIISLTPDVYNYAVNSGNLDVVKYIKSHDIEWNPNDNLCCVAFQRGENKIFEWLMENKYQLSYNEYSKIKDSLNWVTPWPRPIFNYSLIPWSHRLRWNVCHTIYNAKYFIDQKVHTYYFWILPVAGLFGCVLGGAIENIWPN